MLQKSVQSLYQMVGPTVEPCKCTFFVVTIAYQVTAVMTTLLRQLVLVNLTSKLPGITENCGHQWCTQDFIWGVTGVNFKV